ncbi:MAG: 4Fe-4S dicluster domain-containing protein [Deltaproteobacteria bacterium]|nr:4Fe-4S dicluster domain-containing protein [Deltaproteobacteria bacterium]
MSTRPGATILEAAQEAGITIPTLCHHPALEPWGGCRLCLVDVTRADWDGWSKVVVSCLAEADDGLIVDTQSERVVATRRVAADLLLARCPDTPFIQDLAASYGITHSSYARADEPTDCILCGLCTRVCEAYATSAISTQFRGTRKAIGTFAGLPPEDCVGCGACALVCPTGHIKAERRARTFAIWDREFHTAACSVTASACGGCGSCEEACPFSVARVVARAGGSFVATILADHCRGCGACVGACPSGAIDQQNNSHQALAEVLAAPPDLAAAGPKLAVVACDRAKVDPQALPAGSALLEVPCTGRVTLPLLLGSLASGHDAVVVLGRHEQTCRLDGAEGPVRSVTNRARRALQLLGLGRDRVTFLSPPAGLDGPDGALAQLAAGVASMAATPLGFGGSHELPGREGVDATLALLRLLSEQVIERGDIHFEGDAWLEAHRLPLPVPGRPVIYAGQLPYLDIAGGSLFRPLRLVETLRGAVALLALLGEADVGVAVSGCGTLGPRDVKALADAPTVITLGGPDQQLLTTMRLSVTSLEGLIVDRAQQLRRPASPTKVACDGSRAAKRLVEALGYEVVDLGSDPLPDTFSLTPDHRGAGDERLRAAERAGARVLLVPDPRALARWASLTRDGTWRPTPVVPMMAHQLARLAGVDLATSAVRVRQAYLDSESQQEDRS